MPNFFKRLTHALHKEKSDTPPTLGVGTLINGRYRLEEELGRGGMGIVYRAHDLVSDRAVAIKVINLDKANALTYGQFAHEAEIAARLHHPHIVQVYEAGTVDSSAPQPSPFLVMELVPGTSLSEITGLTYARILDIAKQICAALAYAHSQGVIYRDLKPGNVLVERRGFGYFAKLMDFGLARPRGMIDTARESSAAGTLFYLAPELIAGLPADIASDLYALGATLYEMLTGHVPFSDFDEQAILVQHLEEAVRPPSQSRGDVPPALEAIVLRLLQKDPQDRFASAEQVCAALEQVMLRKETSARGNLPVPLPDFAGRDEDVSQLKHLLASNRLVTLRGDAEALALATGNQLLDIFSDGVWCVDLKSVHNPTLVVETVASTLGVLPNSQRPLTVSLIEHLREKNLLLLLLHCEHVHIACAQLVETILGTCPDVYLIVTSQQALGLAGETLSAFGASPE